MVVGSQSSNVNKHLRKHCRLPCPVSRPVCVHFLFQKTESVSELFSETFCFRNKCFLLAQRGHIFLHFSPFVCLFVFWEGGGGGAGFKIWAAFSLHVQ